MRLLESIDDPDWNWKFSLAAVRERNRCSPCVAAYEDCLTATSTRHAP